MKCHAMGLAVTGHAVRVGTADRSHFALTLHLELNLCDPVFNRIAGIVLQLGHDVREVVAACPDLRSVRTQCDPAWVSSGAKDLLYELAIHDCGGLQFASGIRQSKLGDKRSRKFSITQRQSEILQLLAEGMSMKEVANVIDIKLGTVAFHKYRMMETLNVKTNAELLEYAVKRRMTPA
jgi:DNA-binding CsgD family transcriptional regulator